MQKTKPRPESDWDIILIDNVDLGEEENERE